MTASYMYMPSITALNGHSAAFASISQNVSNLTTSGFKSSETLFSDIVTNRNGSIFSQFSGIKPSTRNLIEQQGAIISTNRNLDVAIDGTGFLVTNTAFDGSGSTLLTRAGSIDLRVVGDPGAEQSFLADQNGNFIQGWPSNGAGGFTIGSDVSSLQPIRVDSGAVQSAAVATTTAALSANLPAGSAASANFDLSVGVFDDLGNSHALLFDFTKNAALDTWDVVATTPDGAVSAGSPFAMSFDATGQIVSPANQAVGITWTNPATAAASSVAVDFSGMTQFGGAFTPRAITSNGNTVGTLIDAKINAAGEIVGRFSNGLSQGLAKLPLAVVRNENGLTPQQGTNFSLSPESGALRLLEADQTSFGTFSPQAIEESAVELAEEFSKLIITQRAYSSAAQTIKVVDEMHQVATRLKG
jgi:flagellar hook protein FlgE